MIQSPAIQNIATEEKAVNPLPTFLLASSVSAGSNLVEVRKGRMGLDLAISNALVKGVLATIVLSGSRPETLLQIAGKVCLLGSVGYVVDSLMKPELSGEKSEDVTL